VSPAGSSVPQPTLCACSAHMSACLCRHSHVCTKSKVVGKPLWLMQTVPVPPHCTAPCSNPAAAKRPFTAVTGHSLPKASSQAKANKDHAAARPGGSAKPAGSMLVPPQLQGRWAPTSTAHSTTAAAVRNRISGAARRIPAAPLQHLSAQMPE
jgi:hypothetical protein